MSSTSNTPAPTTPSAPDLTDVLTVARRDGAEAERRGALTPAVVDALRDAGCFALHTPLDLGGLGLSFPVACRVIADIAAADGAAGWAAMIGAGPAWFAAHMDPAGAREVFAGAGAVAGSAEAGRARRDGDDLVVEGRWRFCSGAPWAEWFTFNARTQDDELLTIAVPAADATVHPETWDVRGLRATASCDVSLADVRVPPHRVFTVGDEPRRDETVFHIGFMRFAEATMAAVAAGMARAAVEGSARFALTHERSSGRPADDPAVRRTLAITAGEVEAAVHALHAATEDVWDDARARRTDLRNQTRLQVASVHMAAVAVRAADALAPVVGIASLDRASPLGRVFDDIRAAARNAALTQARLAGVDPVTLVGG